MKSKSTQGRALAARRRSSAAADSTRYLRNHAIEPCEPRLLLAAALPDGYRGWEAVPNVIRTNGTDTFHVEVNPNRPVLKVTFDSPSALILPPAPSFDLRDDGQGGDRVAGDNIYTGGPFRYNTANSLHMPDNYQYDPDSPAGLHTANVGNFLVHELDGTTSSRFLIDPTVAILDKDIPLVTPRQLAPDIVATPHLVNIRSADHYTQKYLRGQAYELDELTKRLYGTLPADDYDFFMFLSTYQVEHNTWTNAQNFTAGRHGTVQANYSGYGGPSYDFSDSYGSAGRLLGVNALDSYDRGMLSYNAVHEILHQWAANLSPSLGLSDTGSHFLYNTSVGSILGGFEWTPNGDGSFTVTDNGSGSGAVHASPLDLYLMGLIDGSEVPDIHVAKLPFDLIKKQQGEPVLPDQIARTVTIEDIQAAHGVRTPGPATAHKDFRLAFVAESIDRLLTPVELTYYEIMAAHFTKELPAGAPDPTVEHNWAPITRFFGHGTTWRSDLTLPEVQKFTVSGAAYLDRNANGLRELTDAALSATRTIFIDLDNDRNLDTNERRTTTAAADGSWSFTDLDPGTYNVCQVNVNGFTVINPDDRCHTVTITDADVTDLDFANFPTRFEGTASDDHFYVRLDPAGANVQLYLNGLAAQPDYTFAPTLLPAYQILGRNGDDLLTVDFANGNPLPTLALLYMGEGDTFATGGPGDRLEVLGAGQTYGSDTASITRDGKGVSYNLVEEIIIKDGTFNFTKPIPLVGLHVADDAEATFAGPQLLTSLTLDGDARVVPNANTVLLATRDVTIADTASLDLQDADLIVQGTPDTRRAVLDALAALVRRSREGSPRWSGSGITSARAAANPLAGLVTLVNDNGSGTPLILNHPILTGGTLNKDMVLVKLTWNGDVNLDSRVNADDYFRIDQGFLAQPQNPLYTQGDFNYDGRINADDYFLIDQAFLGQSAVLASAATDANLAVRTTSSTDDDHPARSRAKKSKSSRTAKTSRHARNRTTP